MTKKKSPNYLNNFYRVSVGDILTYLLKDTSLTDKQLGKIRASTKELVEHIRNGKSHEDPFYDVMLKYNLSSTEGIALMNLVEALLRVPDRKTAYKLIQDKIVGIGWKDSIDKRDPWIAKMSGRGLNLVEKILQHQGQGGLTSALSQGAIPVIYMVMRKMMKRFSHQFVMAETIKKAKKTAKKEIYKKYNFSYDMLGESARTYDMADDYYEAYDHALDTLATGDLEEDAFLNPGISIKLSALHPRYEFTKKDLLLKELYPKVKALAEKACDLGLNVTIDAEEADRLDISLVLIERLMQEESLKGWNGFGLAVQAYQKRAYFLIDWLVKLAEENNQKIAVRLVKGAYWDAEIKQTQEGGYSGYSVFTRKSITDISYFACAAKLLRHRDVLFPQFATHNAYTVMGILEIAGKHEGFEFQRLYGMGTGLYEQLFLEEWYDVPCRIYAPIGPHEDLLPYLVRRLLENGANSSFVYKLFDKKVSIDDVIEDPLVTFSRVKSLLHPKIPLPKDIYMPGRVASKGIDISNPSELNVLKEGIARAQQHMPWHVGSIIDGDAYDEGVERDLIGPSDYAEEIGVAKNATADQMLQAFRVAKNASSAWRLTAVEDRAVALDKMADILETEMARFVTYSIIEAGKTLADAIDEVREAVDFCRYYAAIARTQLQKSDVLQGYTGEINELTLEGRGVFVAISPWNFPLAIFVGQIAAALVAGNTVIAKSAEPTPIVAYHAIKAFHEAGIPTNALHLILASGKDFSAIILQQDIDGVVFTGSSKTAQIINQTIAQQEKIIPLIAETGGINTMIVDSTSLPEQVVDAVMRSAFQSAGQRCSALRLLYLQEDIADEVIEMIKGAMDTLDVGDPMLLKTDVGPVINFETKMDLQGHLSDMAKEGELLHATPRPASLPDGAFMLPRLIGLKRGADLKKEAFGPFLHVVRFQEGQLDQIIEEINHSGYGLTLGIQTRLNERAQYIRDRVRVGNIYVNRDMIGAVVGVQPFGGQGLSGTGPKAGGPHYLSRFSVEKTFTDNITASGGNTTLLNLADESA